jgi:modulator of FtsH protease HflK
MPWNQPSGPNNPWGRRPGQGDLDQRLKSWQKRLQSLFTPGVPGTPGTTGTNNTWLWIGILGFVVLAWLFKGFYQINAPERGVVQRFGRLVDVRMPGMGWRPWPIETVTKVNVANVNSSDFKSRVLTSDVNLVDLHFAVQYQFSDPVKTLFSVQNPEQTLSDVSESAIREIVGRSTLDEVLVGNTRPEITRRAKELIQRILDAYNSGITVTTVNLEDVQVPDAVMSSQRDMNKAQADKERYILEAGAYANSIIPGAQGLAAKLQQDAEAYKARVTALAEGESARFSEVLAAYQQFPEVTRKRMYMDSVEALLARAHKVLIDAHAGSNLIYLPIDKLLEKSTTETQQIPEATGSSSAQKDQDASAEARARGER